MKRALRVLIAVALFASIVAGVGAAPVAAQNQSTTTDANVVVQDATSEVDQHQKGVSQANVNTQTAAAENDSVTQSSTQVNANAQVALSNAENDAIINDSGDTLTSGFDSDDGSLIP